MLSILGDLFQSFTIKYDAHFRFLISFYFNLVKISCGSLRSGDFLLEFLTLNIGLEQRFSECFIIEVQ